MKNENLEEYKDLDKINWMVSTPFIPIHLSCILALWTGISWVALAALFLTYGVRMFGITGGFHRYFSHRSYKTSRLFQFVLAFLGTSSAQKGPLWWASHHRYHHRYADTEKDIHSPGHRGFYWAHVGWILSDKYDATLHDFVQDLAQYPELRFLNRHYWLPPTLLAGFMALIGALLEQFAPHLGTSAIQMVIWGFLISTVFLYHSTFTVNSLAHVIGRRRFETNDDSRNSWLISLMTLGEGWHNNHHRFPMSERQGFYWWEIDISHYILTMLSWCSIVWDLRTPPKRIYIAAKSVKKTTKAA